MLTRTACSCHYYLLGTGCCCDVNAARSDLAPVIDPPTQIGPRSVQMLAAGTTSAFGRRRQCSGSTAPQGAWLGPGASAQGYRACPSHKACERASQEDASFRRRHAHSTHQRRRRPTAVAAAAVEVEANQVGVALGYEHSLRFRPSSGSSWLLALARGVVPHRAAAQYFVRWLATDQASGVHHSGRWAAGACPRPGLPGCSWFGSRACVSRCRAHAAPPYARSSTSQPAA